MLLTRNSILYLIIGGFLIAGLGCSRALKKELRDDEYYFNRGMEFLKKKNYQSAIENFQTVVDSFSGSERVVDAQYQLGEARFKNEEYLTAAYEYERVYSDYPSSEYAADAWYKKALCYFMESPKANLDQENTQLAIDEFNRFIDNFPRHELVKDARERILELESKLAYKYYLVAELYRKMRARDAALIYYKALVEEYPQTVWRPYAWYGMGCVHEDLEEWEDAENMFSLVVNSDTDNSLKKKASSRLEIVQKKSAIASKKKAASEKRSVKTVGDASE